MATPSALQTGTGDHKHHHKHGEGQGKHRKKKDKDREGGSKLAKHDGGGGYGGVTGGYGSADTNMLAKKPTGDIGMCDLDADLGNEGGGARDMPAPSPSHGGHAGHA